MSGVKKHITGKEQEIMKVLWNSDKPLLVSEIAQQVENIAVNSLHPFVRALIDKGYIEVAGHARVSKTFSRLYAPAVTVDEYAAIYIREVFRSCNHKVELKTFLNCMASGDDPDVTVENIAQIEEFVKEFKGRRA